MTEVDSALLCDLLTATKDGDWGQGEPTDGHTKAHVIRGADFADVRVGKAAKVPSRYLPERTIGRRILEPDDILIETAGGSRDRPTWRTLLVTREILNLFPGLVTCASFVRFLRVDSELASPRYVYWYLQDLYNSGGMWVHQVQHTGVARFQYTRFAETKEIPLPPRRQQEAIVAALGALDDKIEVNERIAATARQLGMALFEATVEIGKAPISLEALAVYLNRGQAPKYTGNNDGLIVLNQKCVRNGRVSVDPARKTEAARVHAERRLVAGDVLVNSTGVGTLGRVGIWSHDLSATVDSHCAIVRVNPTIVPPIIGAFAMLSAQPTIEAMGEGSTGQTELSRTKLGRIEIDLPSGNHETLAKKLTALEAKSDDALQESRTLAALRDTLLPQLMSGKLRVRDAERIVEDAV